MANESGTWIMYGVSEDDPECIHTVEEAIEYINEIGFLPLFKNDIPGFSLEERTVPAYWWSGDLDRDPWEWREIIVGSGRVAYGKFFDKKAGFISREWFPYFANYRRDGYDFDALWDDEKASIRQKKIMDLFSEENADAELYSFDIKQKAGFGKNGEKGFEGTIAGLQMQMYLCMRDFRQRKNKKGAAYGWPIAVYSTPEHLWGYDYVTSAYAEEPIESGKKIAAHIMHVYPIANAEQIRRIIGVRIGEVHPNKKKEKKIDYPSNLLKKIKIEVDPLSADQLYGLEFAIGQLKDAHQEMIRLRFEEGLAYKQIGERIGRSATRCGQICSNAILQLQEGNRLSWILEGYQGKLDRIENAVREAQRQFQAEGKIEQASLLDQSPETLPGITSNYAKLMMAVGIYTLGSLREVMKKDFWTNNIPGIGDVGGKKIVYAMYRAGLIDEKFEAYKEISDHEYRIAKYKRLREAAAPRNG